MLLCVKLASEPASQPVSQLASQQRGREGERLSWIHMRLSVFFLVARPLAVLSCVLLFFLYCGALVYVLCMY